MFPVYSPVIDSVKVVRRGKVRRAKLYYLRDRRGKSARIAERTDTAAKDASRTPARRVRQTALGGDLRRRRPEGAVRRLERRPTSGAPAAVGNQPFCDGSHRRRLRRGFSRKTDRLLCGCKRRRRAYATAQPSLASGRRPASRRLRCRAPHDDESSTSLALPVAVDTAYSYRVPADAIALEPGDRRRRRAARDARTRPASSGRCAKAAATISNRSPPMRDWPPLRPAVARLHRLGGALDARPARHGAAHGDPRPHEVARAAGAEIRRRRRPASRPARMTRGARSASSRRSPAPRRRVAKAALAERAGCSARRRSTASSRTARSRSSRCRRSGSPPTSIRTSARRSSTPTRRRPPTISLARVAARAFSATLLEGVTGSGKTEVYFEAIAEALAAGAAGARAPAGDRADRAVPRPLRGALRRAAGRVALGPDRAPARARSGARSRAARRASSSARARRCSCPSPISA